MLRFLDDGSLDDAFANDGMLVLKAPSSNVPNAMIQQADDGLMQAGGANNGANHDFALARFLSDGQADTAWGDEGTLLIPVGTGDDHARALVEQSDGKLVIAGETDSGIDLDMALLRINQDGSLDTGFATGGKAINDLTGGNDRIRALLQLPDQKWLVAGYTDVGTDRDMMLARYNDDGTLDTTFATSGVALFDSGGEDELVTLLRQDDGKLLLVGTVGTGSAKDILLVRLLADGETLDSSFGSAGIVQTDASGGRDQSQSALLQQDGKLLVTGSGFNGNDDDLLLLRYLPDGSLDTGFSGDGLVQQDVSGSTDAGRSIYVQSDDRILVSGSAAGINQDDLLLARFDADGALDTSFGTAGFSLFDDGGHEQAFMMWPSLSDRVFLGAYNTNSEWLLARVFLTQVADVDGDGIDDVDDDFPGEIAASVDMDQDGYPDEWNVGCDTSCQSASSLSLDAFPNDSQEWADADQDGLGDNADSDPERDTNPPIVYAPTDLVLDATGELTAVTLGSATAEDYTDGELTAFPSSTGPFSSGVHEVVWYATDAAGNSAQDVQTVTIYPQVVFEVEQSRIGEGAAHTVVVRLSGSSPLYPIQVPVLIGDASDASTLDHSLVEQEWTIEENAKPADQVTVTFTTQDDGKTGEPDEALILELDDITMRPYIGESGVVERYLGVGSPAAHLVEITEDNLPPTASLELEQGAFYAGTVFTDKGPVSVTVNIEDPDPSDSHTVNWLINDKHRSEYDNQLEIEVPQSQLRVGTLTFDVLVADSGTPSMQATAKISVEVRRPDKGSSTGASSVGGFIGGSSSGGGGGTIPLFWLFAGVLLRVRRKKSL